MVTTTTAERFTPPLAEHGEGPVWFVDSDLLRIVDMLAGDILTIDRSGALIDRRHVGGVVAALRPQAGGGLVMAVERGFALISPEGRLTTLPEAWSDPGVRMNDGACDPQGRFLCGSMSYDAAEGRGALHRLELDGSTTTVLENVTISNGLAFSADGTRALYVDSETQQVRRYRIPPDDGPWSDYEVVVEFDREVGTPDGLCVDADGGIWVALWGGSSVHRYTALGELTDVLTLPVRQVTACALGGSDGRTLFVTTSRLGLTGEGEADAGAIFIAHVEIPGEPVLRSHY